MRGVAIFFAGFAAGILVLGALMWRTHTVGAINTPATSAPGAAATEVRAPASAPTGIPAPPPLKTAPPSVEPPPLVSNPAPSASAKGDVPAALTNLAMPVEGVAPRDLHDNFADERGGHRHEALDIMAPRGTPVHAVAEGNVAKLFFSKAGGITVYQFDDTQAWCFYYAHLDRYAKGLSEGALLRKGDVLGYVGSTGDARAEAPHLHFAIFQLGPEKHWWQGTAIDPYPFLAPR